MFISEAMAQAADAAAATSQGTLTGTLIQLGLIFVIFYVILIRPQQKRMKEHRAMLTSLRRGDMVVTAGGIIAKISKIGAETEDEIELELADNVRVKALRSTLSSVLRKTEPATK